MTAPSWRELDDAAREREVSPSSCIGGNYQPFIAAYAERSAQARARANAEGSGRLNLRYGPGAAQLLDLFLPPAAGPVGGAGVPALLVFIHGGYWQELSKDESSFAAPQCVAQGIAFAAVNYTLAPSATVAEMVAECRLAIAWLHANAAALGFDARRIVVAGSSAGAHLAAMVALPPQGPPLAPAFAPTPAPALSPMDAPLRLRGAVLVSGIYELEVLLGTSVNEALGLTADSARALSPALLPLRGFPPSIVCWGEVETAEFKRQSQGFAACLQGAGTSCQRFEMPQRNHFDVILDLADPATMLGAATLALVSLG